MDGIELLGLLRLFVPTSFRVKAGGTTQVWVRICRAARRKRTFPLESNPDMPESAMTLRISQKGTNRGSPQQSQESQIKLNQMNLTPAATQRHAMTTMTRDGPWS